MRFSFFWKSQNDFRFQSACNSQQVSLQSAWYKFCSFAEQPYSIELMSRFFSGGRVSFIWASSLVLALLFTSIVYACSGLASIGIAPHSGSMNNKVERGPCGEHKQDMCQSVRERTLSVQASLPATDLSRGSPSGLPVETYLVPNAFSEHLLFPTAYHPFFKLPLIYSYLVLRI